jgi:hypothetical protein
VYYIIERNYVGPNPDQHLNDHTYKITTEPGRGNLSNEVRTQGWLGTTNDWSETAHGEYDTEEAARGFVAKSLEVSREIEPSDYDQYQGVIALFAVGQYERLGRDGSLGWCYESMQAELQAKTTDAQIDAFIRQCESLANDEGMTLDEEALRAFMILECDELAAEEND